MSKRARKRRDRKRGGADHGKRPSAWAHAGNYGSSKDPGSYSASGVLCCTAHVFGGRATTCSLRLHGADGCGSGQGWRSLGCQARTRCRGA